MHSSVGAGRAGPGEGLGSVAEWSDDHGNGHGLAGGAGRRPVRAGVLAGESSGCPARNGGARRPLGGGGVRRHRAGSEGGAVTEDHGAGVDGAGAGVDGAGADGGWGEAPGSVAGPLAWGRSVGSASGVARGRRSSGADPSAEGVGRQSPGQGWVGAGGAGSRLVKASSSYSPPGEIDGMCRRVPLVRPGFMVVSRLVVRRVCRMCRCGSG